MHRPLSPTVADAFRKHHVLMADFERLPVLLGIESSIAPGRQASGAIDPNVSTGELPTGVTTREATSTT